LKRFKILAKYEVSQTNVDSNGPLGRKDRSGPVELFLI